MPIDFNRPTTARLYSTEFIPDITQAFAALGQLLDPAVAGTLTNTPSGAHRLNSAAAGGGIFEWFNGSVWAERTMAYPKKDGTGATGTWGISITGNAATATSATSAGSASSVAWSGVTGKPAIVSETFSEAATNSTIAKRNASGQLYASYFNQNSGLENPVVGAVFVQNTAADGFHRKQSIANFGITLGGITVRARKLVTAWDGNDPGIGSDGDIVTARSGSVGTVYFGTSGSRYLHNNAAEWQLMGGGPLKHNSRYYGNSATTGEVGLGAITVSTTAGARAGMVQGDLHLVY